MTVDVSFLTLGQNIARQVGKPYVWGAEGPNTFDCSGLMQYVFGLSGVTLPRTAHEQQSFTQPTGSPQFGDLVFYGAPAHHVGFYIGGGKMIDAPDVNQSVKVEDVGNPTGYGRIPGIRIKADAGVTTIFGVPLDPRQNVPIAIDGAKNALGALTQGTRNLVVEALFVLAGLGLVGIGLATQRKRGNSDE